MTVTHHHTPDHPGCDFCSRDETPAWSYPCEDFIMGEIGPNTHMSTGPWLACAECAKLIEAELWETLRLRLLTAYERQGVQLNRTERRRILTYVTRVHRGFRRHRTAEPRSRV